MSFHDGPDGKRVWISDRDLRSLQDPIRLAAERLADNVEKYLYDRESGVFLYEPFLANAVAQYDADKSGSGNYAQMNHDFDPEEWASEPPKPGVRYHGPTLTPDIAVRAPEHAREAGYVAAPESDPEPVEDES